MCLSLSDIVDICSCLRQGSFRHLEASILQPLSRFLMHSSGMSMQQCSNFMCVWLASPRFSTLLILTTLWVVVYQVNRRLHRWTSSPNYEIHRLQQLRRVIFSWTLVWCVCAMCVVFIYSRLLDKNNYIVLEISRLLDKNNYIFLRPLSCFLLHSSGNILPQCSKLRCVW